MTELLTAGNVRGAIEIFPWEEGRRYIVRKTFSVQTRFGKIVTVKEGFEHDLFTFAPDLKGAEVAAIVHDWLCDEDYSRHCFNDGTLCTRKMADLIFYDLMLSSGFDHGIKLFVAKLYYAGAEVARIWIGEWKCRLLKLNNPLS